MRELVLAIWIFSSFGSLAQEFHPDTTVNQISLESSKSILEKFKADTSLIKERFEESKDVFREVYILNNDKTQILSLIFHPGDSRLNFSEFKVRFAKDFSKKVKSIQLRDLDFTTEKGVRLGISKEVLLKQFGKPLSAKKENGFEILEYRMSDNSKFLKRYRLPEYFAIYKLKKGRLAEFNIGFTYP